MATSEQQWHSFLATGRIGLVCGTTISVCNDQYGSFLIIEAKTLYQSLLARESLCWLVESHVMDDGTGSRNIRPVARLEFFVLVLQVLCQIQSRYFTHFAISHDIAAITIAEIGLWSSLGSWEFSTNAPTRRESGLEFVGDAEK